MLRMPASCSRWAFLLTVVKHDELFLKHLGPEVAMAYKVAVAGNVCSVTSRRGPNASNNAQGLSKSHLWNWSGTATSLESLKQKSPLPKFYAMIISIDGLLTFGNLQV